MISFLTTSGYETSKGVVQEGSGPLASGEMEVGVLEATGPSIENHNCTGAVKLAWLVLDGAYGQDDQ